MDIFHLLIKCTTLALIGLSSGQQSNTSSTPHDCTWPSGIALPTVWHKQEIQNPRTDICKCGRRGKKSWVCDSNGLISYAEADKIDVAVEKLRDTTGGCYCGKKCSQSSYLGENYRGYQMGVVLLKAMYIKKSNPSSKDRKKTADDFTDYLRDDNWEFGLCNDDLLILVSDVDRVVYTATGDKVSGIVTDECVKQITANNKNFLSNKQYGKALVNMVNEYNMALLHEHPCNKPMSKTTIGIIAGTIVSAVLGCVVVAFLRQKFCPDKCKQSGSSSSGNDYSGKAQKYHSTSPSHSRRSSNSSGGGGDTF